MRFLHIMTEAKQARIAANSPEAPAEFLGSVSAVCKQVPSLGWRTTSQRSSEASADYIAVLVAGCFIPVALIIDI
jgi:hypothetical protein